MTAYGSQTLSIIRITMRNYQTRDRFMESFRWTAKLYLKFINTSETALYISSSA